MKINNKNLLVVFTIFMMLGKIFLFSINFLCFEGFLSGIIFYGIVLVVVIISYTNKNAQMRIISQKILLMLILIYLSIIPIGMLINSDLYGGFDFFLNERAYQYVYLEFMALILLSFTSKLYTDEESLYLGSFKKKLYTPLSIALILRLSWMIFLETKHLRDFAINLPFTKVEYIVLVSIPLYFAVWILTYSKIVYGYLLGFLLSLAHIILILLLVAIKGNPGLGMFVVLPICLVICIFSVKGTIEYQFNNDRDIPKQIYYIQRKVLRFKKNPEKSRKTLFLAGVKENMKVLDIGCGIGNYTIEAAKIVKKAGSVIAVDIDKTMLEELEKEITIHKISNVTHQLIHSLEDIKEENFDFILLIDVLQLMKEKANVINFLIRKLAKNGSLLIKFEHFNKDQINSLLEKTQCSTKKLLFKKYWLLSE